MENHLILIDGHHLLYRAYWAIPRTLRTKAGEQVNAVFGFASMVLHILRTERPSHMLFCFDADEKTFRHEQNATYKEGRAQTPDDFYVQIPRVLEFVDILDVPRVSGQKFEADDYLASYARAGEAAGMTVTIVTGDRDAFQLASPAVRVAIPHGGYQKPEYLGPAEVMQKYGIHPSQVADYKGLTGDASDNLPGVKGIGPKSAALLLQEYGTLDAVYEHLSDIKPVIRAKLEADRDSAFFCRRMATLIFDIPLVPPIEGITLSSLPLADLLLFFQEMEFSMLSRRLLELARSPYGQSIFEGAISVEASIVAPMPAQLDLFGSVGEQPGGFSPTNPLFPIAGSHDWGPRDPIVRTIFS